MKILFLTPPALDNALSAERIFGCNYGIYSQPNIFILYPATILKNRGHSVTCIDFPVNRKNKNDFKKFCEVQDFDAIVFYSVFLSKNTDLIARNMLKQANSKTKFIFMSTEPTASPDDFIDEKSIVIRGEPESRIAQVIDALEKNSPLEEIPGISYRMNAENIHQGGYQIIDDLDTLPFPDRKLLDSDSYHNPKLSFRPFTTMIASRGCSFNCYYCVPNSLDFANEIEFKRANTHKPPVRLRSPENVIAEISLLAKDGYRSISFIDDQFIWGAKRTIEICQGIAPFKIEWSCLARADMLQDENVTKEMVSSGCKFVAIGVESFNQGILDYIGKGCKVETFHSAIKNLKKSGIEVEVNILLAACPLETVETIKDTFRETLKLDPDYVLFSICTPFPYTEFNKKARQEGWMVKARYEAIDPIKESFISYPHLTKRQLDKIIRSLYIKYYFRPHYLWKKIIKLKGLKDLVNKVRAALTIFR